MKLKLSLLPFIAITMMCIASACSDDSDDTQFRLDTVTDILTTGPNPTGPNEPTEPNKKPGSLPSRPIPYWIMENTDTEDTYSVIFYRNHTMQIGEIGNSYTIDAQWQLTSPDAMIVTYTESDEPKTLQIKLTEVVSNRILAECDFGNGMQHFKLYCEEWRIDAINAILVNGLGAESNWNLKNTETNVTYTIKFNDSPNKFTVIDPTIIVNPEDPEDSKRNIVLEGQWNVSSPSEMAITYTEKIENVIISHTVPVRLTKVKSSMIKAECDFGNGMQHFELN